MQMCSDTPEVEVDDSAVLPSQQRIFAALEKAETYPHPVERVDVRETHISKVFLTDRLAYKLKKAVRMDFLDFSTLEKRRRFCRSEVDLNRRLSDGVYLGVSAVTKSENGFVLDGKGAVVEVAVRMRRLPENRTLECLLSANAFTGEMLDELVDRLVRFYRGVPAARDPDTVGGWETVSENCEENFRALEELEETEEIKRLFDRMPVVAAATRSFLRRKKRLFERRASGGRIRDGHGDLRCDHVVFDDGVQIIDCIEFNDRFRFADVAADLAFLAMDLDVKGYERTSERLAAEFARRSGDAELYSLLDFYKCYRAVVRIKVNALRLREPSVPERDAERLRSETEALADAAFRYAVQMTRPTVWVVCGLPSSGKSTLALRMAEVLDASRLSLDAIRKELFGVGAGKACVVPFGTGIYTPEAGRLAYGRMMLEAQEFLRKGRSVILDATFADRAHRNHARTLAEDEDANLVFVECRAPRGVLEKRLAAREAEAGVSDARLEHLDAFVERFDSWEPSNRVCRIPVDTSGPVGDALTEVLAEDHALLSRQVQRRTARHQS